MKIEIVDIEEKKRQQREINGGSIEQNFKQLNGHISWIDTCELSLPFVL